jgi:hypothetical protein
LLCGRKPNNYEREEKFIPGKRMIIIAFLLFIKNNFEGCERYWWDVGFQVMQ